VLKARQWKIELGQTTRIMGIVNVTPDSFSGDGCMQTGRDHIQTAIRHARRLIRQGADIIDIGGESTRPGSGQIPVQEEIKRIIPVIRQIAKKTSIPISADTYKSATAQHALDAGASIINNIKGVRAEKSLLKMVKRYDAAIVLMHIQGTPRTMQKNIHYGDICNEILDSLRNSIEICLEIGVKSDKIIIDPGFGFGKTFEQNLLILNRLNIFSRLKFPLLIGTSRKSFIGKVLAKDVDQRTWGTAATIATAILKGTHIVRVHDVKKMRDVVRVTDAILNERLSEVKSV